MNPDVCFHARISNSVSSCISPRISDQSSTIHSISLHTDSKWNNWLAWKFWLFHFQYDRMWPMNMASEHDQQDETLTCQLPNQSGHCLLTSRYFKPCSRPLISPFSFFIKSLTTFNNKDYNRLFLIFLSCHCETSCQRHTVWTFSFNVYTAITIITV